MPETQLVLVVDDDPRLRAVLPEILATLGYAALVARHGAEALDLLRTAHPAAILLDLQMPVMDGPAFVHAYRALPGPHVPIVLMSAAADVTVWADRLHAAALAKPFELDELQQVFARLGTDCPGCPCCPPAQTAVGARQGTALGEPGLTIRRSAPRLGA